MFGVIVAAGYGTRFLPLTKTFPKEMLPLYDKLLIDFILDEFEEAEIKDIIIITSRRKKILDDYFDREVELENFFEKNQKIELLNKIKPRDFNVIFLRQQEMKGTGHALLLTKPILKNEDSFIVAYPDDIFISTPGVSKKLIDIYKKNNKNILTVRNEEKNLSRYGVIDPIYNNNYIYVKKIIEKPKEKEAPSNLISIGRYLFKTELLFLLEEAYKKHTKGEFYHIDSINYLASKNEVMAYKLEGIHLDTGEPYSYIESFLLYMLKNQEGKKILKEFYKRHENEINYK